MGLSTASASHGASADAALPRLTLVLGGARSGKSRYAEALIGERPALYIATAYAGDEEMSARIRAHRARRGGNWTTREAPLDLAAALAGDDARPRLVDCLTLWLSNVMLADRDPGAEGAALIDGLSSLKAPVVFVANEVGLGIVPDNELARRFRDHAGRLNQELAAAADRVVFVAAGLPMFLKDLTR
ncbi:MAG: bifunctional adenosylcobinamide kinase/adenosylcobinamide-phosphate guanylyltransferase [Alphaproteobacteria bacterium]|nr:bifunctional adenosylcobinamide kinase/adenosylcobinamide-phosphate guanylyltransferase [Alphaproteobacteria bacterium]